MAETAALVTVPFYAPVRTDSGSSFSYQDPSPHRMALVQRLQPPPFDPVTGAAYGRQGRMIGDRCVGRLVDIFA